MEQVTITFTKTEMDSIQRAASAFTPIRDTGVEVSIEGILKRFIMSQVGDINSLCDLLEREATQTFNDKAQKSQSN